MNDYEIKIGNNIDVLKNMADNSIDAIITDPPYGLSFMNKKWDYDVPSVQFWMEVFRVLKPGGHVLSFGGTRTYHRMVVNMEDAGFEIRDQIMWLYGSGFPKSLNVGKAIDKLQGNERDVIGRVIQTRMNNDYGKVNHNERKLKELEITKGQSEFEGWGTALKPANEPICLARKPLSEKSVAENVLKWRTGGLNIDGCRISTDDKLGRPQAQEQNSEIKLGLKNNEYNGYSDELGGRFPANIILECICDEITNHNYKGGASRFFYQAKVSKKERNLGLDGFEQKQTRIDANYQNEKVAAKYQAIKAPAKNNHPTVKPINLMIYLCRLITPPGGVILDPFVGSGSTGIAALLEGYNFIGIEMDEDYAKIAEARIKNYEKYRDLLK